MRTQIRLVSDDASRFVGDARDALKIVAGAGSEVKGVFKGTFDELRGATPANTTSRKKTAKKVAAKPAARKAAKPESQAA